MLTGPKIQAKISSHYGNCFGRGSVVHRPSNGEGLRNIQHSVSIVRGTRYHRWFIMTAVTKYQYYNKMRRLFYHKMQQKFITKCIRFFITKCDSFITKCDSYYKIWRFYYKLRLHTASNFPLRHPDNKKRKLRSKWVCYKQSPTYLFFLFFHRLQCECLFLFSYQSVCKFWKIEKISSASFHCI